MNNPIVLEARIEQAACAERLQSQGGDQYLTVDFLDGIERAARIAVAMLAPRTITTVEELEALPDGSVVAIGLNAVKSGDVPWLLALQKEDGMWFSPATEGGVMSSEFTNSALPATVFYTPEETA